MHRQSYDSYLMLYVAGGSAYVMRDGKRELLKTGSFALVDCYQPHVYGSTTGCELYWVHFDGTTAREIADMILSREGALPRHPDRARHALLTLCSKTEERGCLPEAEVNRLLVNVLTEFIVEEKPERQETDPIEHIRSYMLEHLSEPLPLPELAQMANLSPYHFSRLFRKRVGSSPHDFLITSRLNLAEYYLLSSPMSIKDIAFSCGFSSECSFCTCFKSRIGVTPTAYRNGKRS